MPEAEYEMMIQDEERRKQTITPHLKMKGKKMLQNAVNNPEQAVDTTLVLRSYEPTKYNENGKAFQQAVLLDASENAEYKVKIWQGSGMPLTPDLVGQTLPFRVTGKVYNNTTYLSGFWQQPRQPQKPQQGQQARPQPAKAPIGAVGWPQGNKDKLIVAQVVYKALVEKFNDIGAFDVWLMASYPVMKRHIELIMDAASSEPNPPPVDLGARQDPDIPF